jgi:serine/threonine protein phosphatase PrpC
MTENEQIIEWRVIGETVPGASHIRSGTPNQDAILYVRESGRALPILLSVADGHGSPKCFRSDKGSRFAVRKAAQIIGEFLEERRGNFDLTEIETTGEDYLPREIVKKWKKTVEYHLKQNPFTEEELKKLEEKSGANSRKLIEENPLLAYGTTLLAAALEENFVLYVQLGDGDILNVSKSGEVTKPLPEDERLLANETTSLCLKDADKDFRFSVQKISAEESPAIILLSTDGYLNSFSDESGFFQAGTDILQMLAEEKGFESVNENLKGWLEEATQMGSGDDCTVGIIYRPDAAKKPSNASQTEKSDVSTTIENPPSPETSKAIAALTGSAQPISGEAEDVTVTITIKKDKNKTNSNASGSAAASIERQGENTGSQDENKKSE